WHAHKEVQCSVVIASSLASAYSKDAAFMRSTLHSTVSLEYRVRMPTFFTLLTHTNPPTHNQTTLTITHMHTHTTPHTHSHTHTHTYMHTHTCTINPSSPLQIPASLRQNKSLTCVYAEEIGRAHV